MNIRYKTMLVKTDLKREDPPIREIGIAIIQITGSAFSQKESSSRSDIIFLL